ncbi:hypothetical protein BJ322DRAFT_1020214 [Thelephora terrestris]|uniref:Uncharacterized protein n=1 Tax=Thelephora terrestris TaxID=56493 RepID=A0A9P6L6Z3_9AGAM|nr:hypothetical protein BJ322DRAFT_1020214 [Thelephora terrestris]
MPFSRSDFEKRVTAPILPEDLRDIAVLIFREMAMRRSQIREEQTGFENLTDEELHQVMYRTLNRMVTRMYQQDQHWRSTCQQNGKRGQLNEPRRVRCLQVKIYCLSSRRAHQAIKGQHRAHNRFEVTQANPSSSPKSLSATPQLQSSPTSTPLNDDLPALSPLSA